MRKNNNLPGFIEESSYTVGEKYYLKNSKLEFQLNNSIVMQRKILPYGIGGLGDALFSKDGDINWECSVCKSACALGTSSTLICSIVCRGVC